MRPTETTRIASAISDYLDRHEAGDPGASSLRRADIAQACRIAKRHLSREDVPELAALKTRIERLEGKVDENAEAPAKVEVDRLSNGRPEVKERDPALPLEDLARDIGRRQVDVAFRLRQWLAYYETPAEVLDSPVMLADLDDLVGGLRRVAEDLRPLIATVNRIRASTADADMPLLVSAEAAHRQES